MVRRKSDAVREPVDCSYSRAMAHERDNQIEHEQRMRNEPGHEQWSSCWCCCLSCEDLSWYHEEPPSLPTPSGEQASTAGTCAE